MKTVTDIVSILIESTNFPNAIGTLLHIESVCGFLIVDDVWIMLIDIENINLYIGWWIIYSIWGSNPRIIRLLFLKIRWINKGKPPWIVNQNLRIIDGKNNISRIRIRIDNSNFSDLCAVLVHLKNWINRQFGRFIIDIKNYDLKIFFYHVITI